MRAPSGLWMDIYYWSQNRASLKDTRDNRVWSIIQPSLNIPSERWVEPRHQSPAQTPADPITSQTPFLCSKRNLNFFVWLFRLHGEGGGVMNYLVHLNKLEYFIRPIKKKTYLVNCWPSGKYVHLLYMYSILGRGFFCFNYCLNSAWHGGDQFVALLRWCEAQVSLTVAFSSSAFFGLLFLIFLLTITHRFFGNECLCLTLLVKGVNDCLLDICQISSLPHDCVD